MNSPKIKDAIGASMVQMHKMTKDEFQEQVKDAEPGPFTNHFIPDQMVDLKRVAKIMGIEKHNSLDDARDAFNCIDGYIQMGDLCVILVDFDFHLVHREYGTFNLLFQRMDTDEVIREFLLKSTNKLKVKKNNVKRNDTALKRAIREHNEFSNDLSYLEGLLAILK